MKKYCYLVTIPDHWFDVAKRLYDDKIAEPIIWFGDDRHYTKAKKIFGKNVINNLIFLHRPYEIPSVEYSGQHIEFFSSKNYLIAKDRCLKLMDRLDLNGSFNRIDREVYFHNTLLWFLVKFNKEKPDFLVCAEAPHNHVTYLIYEICKFLKIPSYKFVNSMLAPILSLHNMESGEITPMQGNSFGKYDKYIDNKIQNFISIVKQKNQDYEISYMADQRKGLYFASKIKQFFSIEIINILKDIKHNLGWYLLSKYNPINPYNFGVFTRYYIRGKRKKNLKKEFNRNKNMFDLPSKFVYFPLHYEPERTTLSDGGFFHDQLMALINLRKSLPKDIQIVLKEHPSQLYSNMRGSRGRSPLIYNLFKKVKGIKLVGNNYNTIYLIQKSKLVVTITGTVALEAAILEKPSITFGSTWYKGCPNIFEWKDNINLKDIINSKISSSNSVYDFLINHKNKYHILASMNLNEKDQFPEYFEESFFETEINNVYKILRQLFENKIK